METRKTISRSRILAATSDTYRQLIAMAGNTLIMYDSGSARYRNDLRVRQVFRSVAKDYAPDQLNMVLVDIDLCKTETEKTDFIPTFRLFRDGQEVSLFTFGHGKAERVSEWLTELIGPPSSKDGKVSGFQKCDLRHGIQLVIWNTSGVLGIREVADFLAKAMEHFKHHRDNLKTEIYTSGSYVHEVKERRGVLGTIRLSCPEKEMRTAALWTDAVLDAYTNANSVEQMLEELSVWRKTVERQDGYLREVVGLLDKPGGDLLAMAAMIGHSLEKH